MEEFEISESPRKRLKTDNSVPTATDQAVNKGTTVQTSREDAQALKESEVGITEFASTENEGFSGVFKKRYTDFLVNEILPSGEVLHLQSIGAPITGHTEHTASVPLPDSNNASQSIDGGTGNRGPVNEVAASQTATKDQDAGGSFSISEEDTALLELFFGIEKAQEIRILHDRALSNPKARPGELGKITVTGITNKDVRTKIHQTLRRVFNSQLESSADQEGVMVITAAVNRNNRNIRGGKDFQTREKGGRINWDELGGPFLHFTLYKENKDTMEAISFISRQLKMNAKAFQFAGTKDRRGVTVQRVSASRVRADRLASLNPILRNSTLGDFQYSKQNIELGDLLGNEFVITLRECQFPRVDMNCPADALSRAKEIVAISLRDLHDRGYVNYYGLQRFGTFSARTDSVGIKMLQGNFKGACDAILHFSSRALAAAQGSTADSVDLTDTPISTDDKARAEAINIFKTTDKINEALDKLPRKFVGEANLIRHLGCSKNDYVGALQSIPRSLRLMYVHAYQSFVWNFAAGERWRVYGPHVVEGDLVIVSEHLDKQAGVGTQNSSGATVDADGEVIVLPAAEDSAYAAENRFTRARALTAAEAASGKYSIFDVVLPLPGFDVMYPANAMTEFYKSFMASQQGGELDPFDMRRKWKDISLSGGYRKLLSRMGPNYSFDVKLYYNEDEQFVQTDLDKLNKTAHVGSRSETGDKLAVVLKFQLGSSQYATMALRELTRGRIKAHVPGFGGR